MDRLNKSNAQKSTSKINNFFHRFAKDPQQNIDSQVQKLNVRLN